MGPLLIFWQHFLSVPGSGRNCRFLKNVIVAISYCTFGQNKAFQMAEEIVAAHHQEANIAKRQKGSIQERTWK